MPFSSPALKRQAALSSVSWKPAAREEKWRSWYHRTVGITSHEERPQTTCCVGREATENWDATHLSEETILEMDLPAPALDPNQTTLPTILTQKIMSYVKRFSFEVVCYVVKNNWEEIISELRKQNHHFRILSKKLPLWSQENLSVTLVKAYWQDKKWPGQWWELRYRLSKIK